MKMRESNRKQNTMRLTKDELRILELLNRADDKEQAIMTFFELLEQVKSYPDIPKRIRNIKQ